jgi:outer membrane protein OmpA-like peptidoglycan-associated protein
MSNRRALRPLAAALAIAIGLSACAEPVPPPPRPTPGALAIVLGARANMPAPALPVDLYGLLDDSIRSQDTLSVVQVSGTPAPTAPKASLAGECNDATACAAELPQIRQDILDGLTKVRAAGPEADVLGALGVAARETDATSGARQLVVIDNGLQTTGAFRLQNTRILFADDQADLDSLAQRLVDEGRLEPALKGTTVTWVGLTSWSAPQGPADQRPRNNLRLLWEKILGKAGATVSFRSGLQDGAPSAAPDLPEVTPVQLVDTPINAPDPCPSIFDDQVGFVADKPDFRDPARARAVLEPVAQGLISRKQRADLIGYVALREDPGPRPLSLRRAEAVRDELVELGVPGSLLHPVGGGLAPEASGGSEPPEKLAGYRRVDVRSGDCG